MSLYTQNDIIWLHVQETCLILVTTQAAISIDMRLSTSDFTDALSQALNITTFVFNNNEQPVNAR